MRVEWISAVARRDMGAVRSNLQVALPILIVPVLLGVVMPAILVGVMSHATLGEKELEQLTRWLAAMEVPADLPDARHRLVWISANFMLAPIFLLVPALVSSVISADSFAGEKERGTLESLLFTPIDLGSLFVGKVAAALVPALAVTLGTFALATVAVNVAGWSLFGRIFFPAFNWLPLMLLLVPGLAFGTVLLTVYVSLRVSTFQAAYQLGALVVLPVMLLLAGQAGGVLMLGPLESAGVGVVVLLSDVLALRVLLRRAERAAIFETQVRS